MMTPTIEHAISADGVEGGWQFHLAMGPKIMDLLSGQYTDLPLAVVREYMANMLDAYVGMDPATIIPPVLHLPNEFEPWVEFKDFGTGMSFDTVRDVFTGYGVTTKGDDNSAGGGFGIGSKVMFAFMRAYNTADVWNIESRYEGERMIFAATRDEKGMPFMYHIATQETDEPNGVTIRGPVPERLFSEFERAARHILAHFPMAVTLTGMPLTLEPEVPLVKGKGWAIYPQHRYGKGEGTRTDSRVIIGGIPYRLEMGKLVNWGLLPSSYRDAVLDISVPIGTLDIAPSREGLEYSDRTKAGLEGAVKQVNSDILEEVERLIQSSETEWAALSKAIQLGNNPLFQQVLHEVKWRGKTIDLNKGIGLPVADIAKTLGVEVQVLVARSGKCQVTPLSDPAKHELLVTPRKSTIIIINDGVKRGVVSRYREAILDIHAPKRGYDQRRQPRWEQTYAYLVTVEDPKDVDQKMAELSALLGGYPVTQFAKLSEVEVATVGPRGKVKLKEITGINGRGYVDGPDIDDLLSQPGDAPILYVRMSGNAIEGRFRGESRAVYQSLARLGKGGRVSYLVGVPKTRQAEVDQHPEFVELEEHAPKVLADALKGFATELANRKVLQELEIPDSFTEAVGLLPTDHILSRAVARQQAFRRALRGSEDAVYAIHDLARRLGVKVRPGKPTYRKAGLEKVLSYYPMLLLTESLRFSYQRERAKQEVLKYIEQMDLLRYLNG